MATATIPSETGDMPIEVVDGIIYRVGTDETIPLAVVQSHRDNLFNQTTNLQEESDRILARRTAVLARIDRLDTLIAEVSV
jgi:hypothetical protein